MAFAARCPACTTLFRVVPDQLKLADGWVRCGRCDELFNAGDALVDPERADVRAAEHEASEVAPALGESPALVTGDTPPPVLATSAEPCAAPEPEIAAPLPDLDLRADLPPIAATPSFLRTEPPPSRWPPAQVRRALGLGSLAAALLLALQVLVHFRDTVAAQGPPGLRVIVEGLCNLGGCRIETPRRLDSLAVDHSALAPADGGAVYRLSLVLRNGADVAVMMPALDLTLTDAHGRVIARRVLRADELGVTQSTLPAGGAVPLLALLDTGETRVAGYTIEAFYP